MRILHSADWHLGQPFFGKTRQAEHQALIQWLITQVQTHHIDAVILAGDIFDTGTPPSYARELYCQLIHDLHQQNVQLLILGGNHDSVATLNETRPLLFGKATHVVASTDLPIEQQIICLNQSDGTVGAIVCAVPFIRARDIMYSEAGQSAQDKQQSLQEAIAQHYQTLYAMAQAKQQVLGKPVPIIMTGHLTTVGTSLSESMRDIYVGSLEAFPTDAFPPADYIALGHIHRPQKVGGLEHIRYSGSPIALSFDELKYSKEMLMLDFEETGLAQITPLDVPHFQAMASIQGDLKSLGKQIDALCQNLTDPDQVLWLEIIVETDDYLSDLQNKIQELTQAYPVEVIRTRRNRQLNAILNEDSHTATLEELSPKDVFQKRLEQETLDDATQTKLTQMFQQTLQQLQDNLV